MKFKDIMYPMGVMILVLLIGYLVFNTVSSSQYNHARDKTMNEVDSMNMSDGYKQGWIDALNRMDAWYYAPVNTTMKG